MGPSYHVAYIRLKNTLKEYRAIFCLEKIELATPAGFEPATTRLEGECSIQLSYGRFATKDL